MRPRLVPVAAAAGAALVTLAAGACASTAGGTKPAAALTAATTPISTTGVTDSQTGLTVDGVGTVHGTPDVLTLTIGIHTSAPRASDALGSNNQRSAALINTLKGNGVAAADLQTSQLNLYPNYSNSGVITGYQVDDTVTAKLRDLGRAGTLIDLAAAQAGDAVRIQGISFSIENDSALVAAARKAAVTEAKAKAAQLADAAGMKLGAIRSITDTSDVNPPAVNYDVRGAAATTQGAVPIQAGSETLEVHVSIVYDLAS